MYESRKIMGDVCKDVSSSVEKCKDVLSEEHEHHRDSEPRQDEAKLHLSDATQLGIEDYVIHDLRKIFSQEYVAFECRVLDPIGVVVRMRMEDRVIHVFFSWEELKSVRNIYGNIKAVCIAKFKEALKGVAK